MDRGRADVDTGRTQVQHPGMDLFVPYALGRLQLRNRFVRSATTSAWADDRGIVGPEIVGRYGELAAGDVGLIVKGHLYVDRQGEGARGHGGRERRRAHPRARAGDRRASTSTAVSSSPRSTTAAARRRPASAWGRATVETPEWRARAMDAGEIREAIGAFGEAARRCVDAGFDGVQIHAAHGYLVSQFLSRLANRRTDEWGGSLTNRARLLREVYLEIRSRLGDDVSVGVKLNCDDFSEDGFTVEEAAEVAGELSRLGVDFIEVSGGGFGEERTRFRARARSSRPGPRRGQLRRPLRDDPRGHRGDAAGPRRRAVAAWRPCRPSSSGLADLVSLSRPFIRERDLVTRLAAGQPEATCTRCDGCFDCFGETMLRCALD